MESGLTEVAGYILIDSWAGRQRVNVTIIGETAKKYRVRLRQRASLPGRRRLLDVGEVTLVPKDVVRREVAA